MAHLFQDSGLDLLEGFEEPNIGSQFYVPDTHLNSPLSFESVEDLVTCRDISKFQRTRKRIIISSTTPPNLHPYNIEKNMVRKQDIIIQEQTKLLNWLGYQGNETTTLISILSNSDIFVSSSHTVGGEHNYIPGSIVLNETLAQFYFYLLSLFIKCGSVDTRCSRIKETDGLITFKNSQNYPSLMPIPESSNSVFRSKAREYDSHFHIYNSGQTYSSSTLISNVKRCFLAWENSGMLNHSNCQGACDKSKAVSNFINTNPILHPFFNWCSLY